MTVYHINPDTGNPGACKAKPGQCPFGAEDQHFSSKEAARTAYEADASTFMRIESDLKKLAPAWSGKLDPKIEARIAEKLSREYDFLAKVESGAIETKYADIHQFLTPPIHAMREMDSYFANDGESFFYDNLNTGEYFLELKTRQGGKNRECHCNDLPHESDCIAASNKELESHPQYFNDDDDAYGSTYATFYFRGGFTDEDVRKHNEQGELSRRASMIRELKEKIESGNLGPWAVFSGSRSSAHLAYQQAKETLDYNLQIAKKEQESLKITSRAIDSFTSGKPISDEDIEALNATMGWGYQLSPQVNDRIKVYHEAKNERIAAEKMIEEAQKLPDGTLKEHLLADRGERSYETTEKFLGRYVKKKYYKTGSFLGSHLSDKKRAEDSAYKYGYVDNLKKLKDLEKSQKSSIKSVETSVKNLEKLRIAAWRDGWSGLVEDLPPIPDSF